MEEKIGLKKRIDEDIKAAMKRKDQTALRGLRAIKAAILLAETSEGKVGELSEDDEMKLLVKQAKQRRDSIAQFEANGRADLAVGEREELEIIEQYLPKALGEDEVRNILRALAEENGAKTPQDLGKLMKAATQKLAGQADGAVISKLAKEILSGA